MTSLADRTAAALGQRDELREEELPALIAAVTGLDGEDLRQAAMTADDVLVAAFDDASTLHARPGGWTISLSDAMAKSAIATAITAAVLAVVGLDQLPALVLPAVLPLLVDLEHVELSPGDEHLLATLRLRSDVIDHARTPKALYKRLPKHLREQVAMTDFLDFVDRLVNTGEADRAGRYVILRDADDPAWIRVQLR
jgi:hypothetical protein